MFHPGRGGGNRPHESHARQGALACAAALSQGPRRPRDLKAAIPDAYNILHRNIYGWFVAIERGVYNLTETGRTAFLRWPQMISSPDFAIPCNRHIEANNCLRSIESEPGQRTQSAKRNSPNPETVGTGRCSGPPIDDPQGAGRQDGEGAQAKRGSEASKGYRDRLVAQTRAPEPSIRKQRLEAKQVAQPPTS
jgi:Putative PD-(D/E)XK phosphodiesterase (DUF2161)